MKDCQIFHAFPSAVNPPMDKHSKLETPPPPYPNLLDPYERVVKFRVHGLQVFEGQRLVQDALVEGQRETRVDELAMEQSLR